MAVQANDQVGGSQSITLDLKILPTIIGKWGYFTRKKSKSQTLLRREQNYLVAAKLHLERKTLSLGDSLLYFIIYSFK
jgi:hypothetical protein